MFGFHFAAAGMGVRARTCLRQGSGPQLGAGEAQPPPARRPSAAVSDGCVCLAQPSLAFESLGRRLLGKEKTEPGLLARDTALLFLCRSLGFSLFQPSVAWIQASPVPAPCEMESVCLAATGSEQPAGCLVPNPKDPPIMGCWHRLVGMCQ